MATLDSAIIFNAARCCDLEMIKDLLACGFSVNSTDSYGKSILHAAALEDNVEVVHLLIKYGADVNLRDQIGETPLYNAACRSLVDVTRLLVERGADVKVQNRHGDSPLHLAISYHEMNCGLRKLVSHASFKEDQGGKTSTCNSRSRNNMDTIRLLVERGADVNVQNQIGKSALVLAIEKCRTPLVAYLFQHGAILPSFSESDYIKAVVTEYLPHVTISDTELIGVIFEDLSKTETNDVIQKANLSEVLGPGVLAKIRPASRTVRSLQKLCRKSIRRALNSACHGQGMSSAIKQLPLPRDVQSFLLLDELHYDGAIDNRIDHRAFPNFMLPNLLH